MWNRPAWEPRIHQIERNHSWDGEGSARGAFPLLKDFFDAVSWMKDSLLIISFCFCFVLHADRSRSASCSRSCASCASSRRRCAGASTRTSWWPTGSLPQWSSTASASSSSPPSPSWPSRPSSCRRRTSSCPDLRSLPLANEKKGTKTKKSKQTKKNIQTQGRSLQNFGSLLERFVGFFRWFSCFSSSIPSFRVFRFVCVEWSKEGGIVPSIPSMERKAQAEAGRKSNTMRTRKRCKFPLVVVVRRWNQPMTWRSRPKRWSRPSGGSWSTVGSRPKRRSRPSGGSGSTVGVTTQTGSCLGWGHDPERVVWSTLEVWFYGLPKKNKVCFLIAFFSANYRYSVVQLALNRAEDANLGACRDWDFVPANVSILSSRPSVWISLRFSFH